MKRILATLSILFLLTGAASAQYFGKNKVHYESFEWLVYHSPHFDLYYYPEEEALASQAALLVEEAYERLAILFDHRPSARVPLVLYSAHPFFQQTNVTPELIGESTGGFTDIYRSRVVLPYNGSVSAFRHVVAHELVHVFMLDILYGGIGPEYAMRTLGQMQMPPLWFIEGLAEYLSTGWDSEAEQFLQDSVAGDYLYPLDSYFGGFMVYKEGQALIRYLVENYGEGVLAELVRGTRREKSFQKGLEKRLGMDLKELSRQFRREVSATAWRNMEGREDPSRVAFPLREHEKERKVFFRNPALSPAGDRVVYFADHKGEVNLYLADVSDGRQIRKLVTGHRSMDLESLHPFDSGACFNPAGDRLVFVALRGGRDELVIIDAEKGDELDRFRPPLDSMRHPAWSPDGERIVVSGAVGGVTDLWLLDLAEGRWTRLSEDLADEQDPAWMDDETLVFARHEALFPGLFDAGVPAPGDLPLDGFGTHSYVFDCGRGYDLWNLKIGGEATPLVSTAGNDRSPMPRPGGGLFFSSDAAGLADLWTWNEGGVPSRMLALAGGILDPELSAEGDKLVFTTLRAGGYDLFLHEQIAELAKEEVSPDPEHLVHRPFSIDLPAPVSDQISEAEELDSLAGLDEDYKVKFLVDAVGRQVTYHSLYGFYGSSVIQLKDVLGDHEVLLMLDIFGRISDSNFLLGYTNRKNRFNWSAGAYSFLNFYQSTVSGLEETLPEDRLFYEWSRGAWIGGVYPFSLFSRLEADLNFYYTRREYFTNVDLFGDPVEDEIRDPENRLLLQPGLSFVYDDALYDYLGPVKGSRWILSLSYSRDVAGDIDVNRWVGVADWRKYLLGPGGHSLAIRLSGKRSDGLSGAEGKGDPIFFNLGGPSSLRGYDYLEFTGTRSVLGSVEWRFPFIRGVWFGGPIPMALGNIGGAFFADFGGAWNEGDAFQLATEEGGYHLHDLKGNIGYGLRFNLGGWLLLWDFAWPTDLQEMGERRVHFSIGAQF